MEIVEIGILSVIIEVDFSLPSGRFLSLEYLFKILKEGSAFASIVAQNRVEMIIGKTKGKREGTTKLENAIYLFLRVKVVWMEQIFSEAH